MTQRTVLNFDNPEGRPPALLDLRGDVHANEVLRQELEKVLSSPLFTRSERLSRFLRFVVEKTLQGQSETLKEYLLAVEVFDKKESYEPGVDTIVRVEASRLRNKLREYYDSEGREDPFRIDLPKGSYVPVFKTHRLSAVTGNPPQAEPVAAKIAQPNQVQPSANNLGSLLLPSKGDALNLSHGRKWLRIGWFPTRVIVLAGGILLVIMLVTLNLLRKQLFPRSVQAKVQSLAVLPLENLSGDPSQEYFADGMTDVLITRLAGLSSLRVISRTSAMHYKGTRKPLTEIAQELNVDTFVEGSVVRSGKRVRINVQLIQATPERHLWAEAYERDLSDVVALQDDVTRAIGNEIRIKLTPQQKASLASSRPVNAEAYEAYLKGRYFWHKWTDEGFEKARQYFQQSIDLDPTYAPAYAGLASYYGVMALTNWLPPQEAWSKAEEILTKVLAMDDTLAEAHAMLGQVKLYLHCDRLGAEKEERRALELDSGSDRALNFHSYYLLETGQTDQAIAEKKRVLERDPLSLETNAELGLYFLEAGRNDEAIQQLQKTLELDSNDATTHARLGQAFANKQQFEQAVAETKRALVLDETPGRLGKLGDIYARWGKRTEALAVISQLQQMSKRRHVSPTLIATIYVRLGEKEKALKWLERAQWADSPEISNHGFDSLRSDPRFKALKERFAASCS